jgi:hypothetical protein
VFFLIFSDEFTFILINSNYQTLKIEFDSERQRCTKGPDTLEDPPIIEDPFWTNDAKDSLEDPPLKINFF